jgi:hypothetical protein
VVKRGEMLDAPVQGGARQAKEKKRTVNKNQQVMDAGMEICRRGCPRELHRAIRAIRTK